MEPDWIKRIGIAGIVIISAVLAVFFWKDRQEGQKLSAQIQAYKDERYPLERQLRKLEAQEKEVKQEYETVKGNANRLVSLVVTQTGEDLYREALPLFQEYDMAGTFVIDAENLPGEEGQISEQECRKLLDMGWEAALGGTLEGEIQDWQKKLEADLAAWESMGLASPVSYVFLEAVENKSQDTCRGILEEHGFTTVSFPEENEKIVKRSYQAEELLAVGSTPYYEETTYVKEFIDSLPGGAMTAVTVRSIGEDVKDLMLDCSESKYRRLLEYLYETSDTVKTVTLSGMLESKERAAEEAKDRQQEYEQALQALEAEKEACQEELDEIVLPDLS